MDSSQDPEGIAVICPASPPAKALLPASAFATRGRRDDVAPVDGDVDQAAGVIPAAATIPAKPLPTVTFADDVELLMSPAFCPTMPPATMPVKLPPLTLPPLTMTFSIFPVLVFWPTSRPTN